MEGRERTQNFGKFGGNFGNIGGKFGKIGGQFGGNFGKFGGNFGRLAVSKFGRLAVSKYGRLAVKQICRFSALVHNIVLKIENTAKFYGPNSAKISVKIMAKFYRLRDVYN